MKAYRNKIEIDGKKPYTLWQKTGEDLTLIQMQTLPIYSFTPVNYHVKKEDFDKFFQQCDVAICKR